MSRYRVEVTEHRMYLLDITAVDPAAAVSAAVEQVRARGVEPIVRGIAETTVRNKRTQPEQP